MDFLIFNLNILTNFIRISRISIYDYYKKGLARRSERKSNLNFKFFYF